MNNDKLIQIISNCFDQHKDKTEFLNAVRNQLNDKPTKEIIWKDTQCDIKTQWWRKIGTVNSIPYFELYCNKEIQIILKDLNNNTYVINEGTINAGYSKALSLL